MNIDGKNIDETGRLRLLRNEETEGERSPQSEWTLAAQNAHAEWVESIRQRCCDKAAKDASYNGEAVLIYIEDGKFCAQRVDRAQSSFKEWTPSYLRRRGA